MQKHSINRSNAAFVVIISLLLVTGVVSVFALRALSETTSDIYRHPFTVTNAVKNIEIKLLSMHQQMLAAVEAEAETDILAAVEKIDAAERANLREFALVEERYLGDTATIRALRKRFIEWKPLRDQVIYLKRSGQHVEATALAFGDQAEYLRKLRLSMSTLIEFALNKADNFLHRAKEKERTYMGLLVGLLLVAVMTSIAIALRVVGELRRSSRELLQRSNLIDERIMLAQVDINGTISDLSRSLSRTLGIPGRSLVGTSADKLLPSGEKAWTLTRLLDYGEQHLSWEGKLSVAGEDERWFEVTAHATVNPEQGFNGYTLLYADISEKRMIAQLMLRDSLTDMPNRRAFDRDLARMVRLARRQSTPLTMAILDVDHFKQYNDRHGHPAGDEILRRVAAYLCGTMRRPNDGAYRVGGEEFALLFDGVDCEHSRELLDKIRAGMEDMQIPHEGNAGVSEYLTVSIGAVCSSDPASLTPEVIYARADVALYRAKQQRNNTEVIEQAAIHLVQGPAGNP